MVELDLWQDALDYFGEKVGQVQNLIGVIAGAEQGIHQSIDMTYKDKFPQVGEILIRTWLKDNDFKKLCVDLGIECCEYPICHKCKNVIWGTHTYDDNGEVCFDCRE